MNVHIANFDPVKIGGGWTATRYLYEGLSCVDYDQADVYLITGASMVNHSDVEKAKQDGKRIVLRVDNHLLPSRNRNTGMSRMKAFAQQADQLIYQSKWAHDYLSPILGKSGDVILNGVDTRKFYTSPLKQGCIYVRSSRIAEKGWEMARFWYSQNAHLEPLTIVGKFSRENMEYNFDFINNEHYRFVGEQGRDNLASMLRDSKYFLYSYFMDACSNTLLEARASGCEIVDVYGMLKTGGAPEIMACEDISVERMIKEYKEVLG